MRPDVILTALAKDADGFFKDNVHGKCSTCGVGIAWRPHIEAAYPDVRKVCHGCFIDEVGQQRTP